MPSLSTPAQRAAANEAQPQPGANAETDPTIRFAVPKGRMNANVQQLLADAGAPLTTSDRGYRPRFAVPGFNVKILKPRAIVEMLRINARDLGFAGADWIAEATAEAQRSPSDPTAREPVELLDTGFDRVRVVAAAPDRLLDDNARLPDRRLTIASEYVQLATAWAARRGIDARLLRSYGATEVLPPEDADCIIDNTATGATLAANALVIVDELLTSSTRLYASQDAMDNPIKRDAIERFVLLLTSVLDARRRAMLEFNVPADDLDRTVRMLPCMREPTVAPLLRDAGYAVRAAVPRDRLAELIPLIKSAGGTDIIVTNPEQIVP